MLLDRLYQRKHKIEEYIALKYPMLELSASIISRDAFDRNDLEEDHNVANPDLSKYGICISLQGK